VPELRWRDGGGSRRIHSGKRTDRVSRLGHSTEGYRNCSIEPYETTTDTLVDTWRECCKLLEFIAFPFILTLVYIRSSLTTLSIVQFLLFFFLCLPLFNIGQLTVIAINYSCSSSKFIDTPNNIVLGSINKGVDISLHTHCLLSCI
jgi:hypothetical protein